MRLRRYAPAAVALVAVSSISGLAWAGPDFKATLADNGPLVAALVAFVGGLLVCLTPCVYPMIAITVSVFGARQATSRRKGMLLSTAFVLGIVAMFAPLGVIAGLTGNMMGGWLQSRWVLAGVAIIFLAMAASMFGAFEMVLPEALMQRLSGVGGIGYGGAFLLGLVSGVIASPCTGPVLTAILLSISNEGAHMREMAEAAGHSVTFVEMLRPVGLGALWMTFFSLGLGLPFWLVGSFAVSLPKGGKWMTYVKSFFGVVMAIAALYYVQLAFPQTSKTFAVELSALWGMKPTAAFLAVCGGFAAVGLLLGAIHLEFGDEGAGKRLRKGIGVLFMVFAGTAAVATMRFEPDEPFVAEAHAGEPPAGSEAPDASAAPVRGAPDRLTFLHSENDAWQRARNEKRPLLIDFFAEWCGACKDLSKKTFGDDKVRAEAARFVAVKLDLTVNVKLSDEEQEAQEAEFDKLKKKYGVVGLPTVILFDSEGKERDRFFEFISADDFLARIASIH